MIAKDITDKPKLVSKCLAVIGDDLQSAVRRHDTCRVVQMCLKHGNAEQQGLILSEMEGVFKELACSKYSIHLAAKVFKLAENKEELAFMLIPEARKIITQKEGSKFLQVLFDAKYRSELLKALFGGPTSAIESTHLRDFLSEDETNLATVGKIVTKCLSKDLQGLNIVQVVTLEYIENLSDQEAKIELLTRFHDHLMSIMDNRAGVRIAILSLAVSDNKARKAILKTVKGYLGQLCQGEYSFLFAIKLLSTIDDTKRIGSLVSADIGQDLESIISVNQGVKVLDSLLFDTWKKRLSLSEWELIDEDLNQSSKKDATIRRKEVLKTILPRLAWIVKERIREFAVDALRSSLVLGLAESLISGIWSDSSFITEFAKLLKVGDIVNNSIAQRVIKKVVETEAESQSFAFAEAMLGVLAGGDKGKVLQSRGVWILVALAEKSVIKGKVRELFEDGEVEELGNGQKGEKALSAALRAIR